MADYFDADDAGTNWGAAANDFVAPQPSGASWDVFGSIGDLFDSAAGAVTDWYELSTTKDLAKIERERMKEAARISALGYPQATFGADYGLYGQPSQPVNYPMWSLVLAAVGLTLTVYAMTRKRR